MRHTLFSQILEVAVTCILHALCIYFHWSRRLAFRRSLFRSRLFVSTILAAGSASCYMKRLIVSFLRRNMWIRYVLTSSFRRSELKFHEEAWRNTYKTVWTFQAKDVVGKFFYWQKYSSICRTSMRRDWFKLKPSLQWYVFPCCCCFRMSYFKSRL